MNLIRQAISDSKTGIASVKRLAIFMATATLSISTLGLTALVYWRPEVVPALTAFGMTLGAIGGSSYVLGKPAERQGQGTP